MNPEEKMNSVTLRRLLARIPFDKPRPATRHPTRRIPRCQRKPGHFELDLVHHCSLTATEEYICTLISPPCPTAPAPRTSFRPWKCLPPYLRSS